MTAAARRGGAGGQGFLGLSAALHLLALGAVLWWAGRVPGPEPAEVPVSLVWNNAAEGAGDGSAGGSAPPPLPLPSAPPLPPAAPTGAAASAAAPATPPAAAPPAPAPPVAEPAPAPSLAEAPPPPPVAPEPAPIVLPLPPPPAPPRPQERAAERPAEASLPQAAPPPPTPPSTWQPPARPGVAEGLAALSGGGGLAAGAVVPARPAAGAANASPEYPHESRVRGEQGRVTLLVQVDAAGRVRDLSVVGSSGHAALDEEAARTVRGWHFEPATQDGRAVFSSVTVGITFRLEGNRRW